MESAGQVFKWREAQWRERGNGVRSLPLASEETGARRLLTGMTEVPAGQEIPLHSHSSEEFILVLDGEAVVRVEGAETRVGPLDATLIQEGVVHQFVNVGAGPLRIAWVYGDPHTTRTLVATGQTLGHLEPYPSADGPGGA